MGALFRSEVRNDFRDIMVEALIHLDKEHSSPGFIALAKKIIEVVHQRNKEDRDV